MPRVKPAALPQDADDELDDATSRDGSFTQRVVSAAGSARPPTSAANSVFGQISAKKAGRPAGSGTPLQYIDAAAVQIRSGVPLPPSLRDGAGGPSMALLKRMTKGDSVLLPQRQARTMLKTARQAGVKMVARSMAHDPEAVKLHGSDVHGVWRLS